MGHNIKPGVATGDQVQEILIMLKKRLCTSGGKCNWINTINGVLETAAKLNLLSFNFQMEEHIQCRKGFLMQMKSSNAGVLQAHCTFTLWQKRTSNCNFTY
jgi:hypothetical protein